MADRAAALLPQSGQGADMVYEPGVEWGEEPPEPSYWMHQLGRDERSLDGDKLLDATMVIALGITISREKRLRKVA